jgi:fructose-1-phosphate kinase PfkB-like protein
VDARGPELLIALEEQPLVVKPNRVELEATVGRPLDSDAAIHSAMRHLAFLGAKWVVVSDGSRPLWLLGHDTLCAIRPPSSGRVVNPIGSGDCLAAGIAVGLARGLSVPDAVEVGVRAAAANLQTLLPVRSDDGGLLRGMQD